MQDRSELIRTIQTLCRSALNGELFIETFYESWPEETSTNAFFKQVYEDIEDGVQHLPDAWLTGGIPSREWYKSNLYFTIFVDFVLLGYDRGVDELIRCREFVLRQRNLSEGIIKDKVKEYFDQ